MFWFPYTFPEQFIFSKYSGILSTPQLFILIHIIFSYMTTFHIPDVLFHKVMQKIDNETPGLPDEKLMEQTREKIVSIVRTWVEK